MPKLEEEIKTVLNSISKFLVSLSTQVDTLQKQVDKLQEDKQVKLAPKAKKIKKKAEAKKTSQADQPTLLDAVYDVIKKSRNGATIAKIIKKTDIAPKQLSNALYKLTKKNKIEAKSRGLYIKK